MYTYDKNFMAKASDMKISLIYTGYFKGSGNPSF